MYSWCFCSSITNHFFSTSSLCYSISSLSCSTFSLSLSISSLSCSTFSLSLSISSLSGSTFSLSLSISSLSCSTFGPSLSTDNLLCSIFISCTSSWCAAFCFRQLVDGLLAAWFMRNVSLYRSLSCEGRILSGQLLQPASEKKDKRKHNDWC